MAIPRRLAFLLGMPKMMLRLMFGPRRSSATYDALRTRNQQQLADGGRAGRFAPCQQSDSDLSAWRDRIMSEFAGVNRELRTAIARWPESKLDRLRLPHPLLGKLTIREMLFFTLYHHTIT